MGLNISNEAYEGIESLKAEITDVFEQLYNEAKPEEGDILVVGCSTSEVAARKIGTFSNKEVGEVIFDTFNELCKSKGLYLATQCCEHLNRAIIVEKTVAKARNLTMVNVVPQLKAGGALSTAAYNGMEDAVAVEYIQAELGIDIGDTLIGMHLKPVAVPVRLSRNQIGSAHVVCARTRLKFIGGERAIYK